MTWLHMQIVLIFITTIRPAIWQLCRPKHLLTLACAAKAVKYNDRLKMKRDAWVKVVFLLSCLSSFSGSRLPYGFSWCVFEKRKLQKSKNFRCNIAIWYPPILGNKRDAFRGKGTLYKIFHPLFHPGKSLKVLKIVLIWLPWRFFSALESENDKKPNHFAEAEPTKVPKIETWQSKDELLNISYGRIVTILLAYEKFGKSLLHLINDPKRFFYCCIAKNVLVLRRRNWGSEKSEPKIQKLYFIQKLSLAFLIRKHPLLYLFVKKC